MDWSIWLCIVAYVAGMIGLHWYAIKHRDRTFWKAFLDPFGHGPIGDYFHRSDAEALRGDWEAIRRDWEAAVKKASRDADAENDIGPESMRGR